MRTGTVGAGLLQLPGQIEGEGACAGQEGEAREGSEGEMFLSLGVHVVVCRVEFLQVQVTFSCVLLEE